MIINVKKVNENAVLPVFAHETDTGFDLFTCEDITLEPYEKGIAKTGLIFELPFGWGIQVRNKSGNTVKGVPDIASNRRDITVFLGTIDSDYRGEVGIMVQNNEFVTVTIPKGTKLAQGVLEKVYHCEFKEVEEVNNTNRGEGGFGSTGTNYKEVK